MHLDPCGAIMDYVRDPYDVPVKPFANSDTQVTLSWRPASPDADVFEEQHQFTSLFHSHFPWADDGQVGEVFDPSIYHGGLRPVNRWWNNLPALGYDVGLTPCEPLEAFREGETFDPFRPAAEYNEDGFPRCCLAYFKPRLGLVWGMRSVVSVVSPLVPNTCGGAGGAPLGVTVEAILPAGAIYWYRLGILSGAHRYHIRYGFPLPSGGVQWTCTPWAVQCLIASGPSDFGTIEEERDITVFTSPTDLSFYLFNPDGANAHSFRFKLTIT